MLQTIQIIVLMAIMLFTRMSQANSMPDFNFEGEINHNRPYLFISLGRNCWPAQALRMHGFRDAAFPFDWLITSDNDGLVKCLNENFEHFTDTTYFQKFGKIDTDNICYNFRFTHDWPHKDEEWNPQKYLEQLDFIKNKYERRIKRFFNINNFTGKVFFIRSFELQYDYVAESGWNTQNVKKVYDALKRLFPAVDFTLVVISVTDPKIPEIDHLDGVIEYKIDGRDITINDDYKTFWAELKVMFMNLAEPYRTENTL